jgi:glutaredoxin
MISFKRGGCIVEYILYSLEGCSKCHQAKLHLEKEGVPFKEKRMLEDQNVAKQIKKLLGEIVTPVLVTDEDILVGNEIFTFKKGDNKIEDCF